MTNEVQRLPGEPIVIACFLDPFDATKEPSEVFRQIFDLRDGIEDDHYYTVIDVTSVKGDFSSMVLTLGEAAKVLRQRTSDKQVKLAIVGSGTLVELAAKAMEQDQYGSRKVSLFTSMEDALVTIRADLAI